MKAHRNALFNLFRLLGSIRETPYIKGTLLNPLTRQLIERVYIPKGPPKGLGFRVLGLGGRFS